MSDIQETKRAATREEVLRYRREALAQLEAKYGLDFPAIEGRNLAGEARRLQLPQRLLNNETTVIPCSAELRDAGIADPCLVVPASWPVELLPSHKSLAVGGQVISISRSLFSLPRYIMDAAWRSTQIWQGSLMPILVMIEADAKYLVRANTWFFRSGQYRGQDIEPSYTNEPDERDLKRGNYIWGDDMSSEVTIVVARF
jgi:hypothetical protein